MGSIDINIKAMNGDAQMFIDGEGDSKDIAQALAQLEIAKTHLLTQYLKVSKFQRGRG